MSDPYKEIMDDLQNKKEESEKVRKSIQDLFESALKEFQEGTFDINGAKKLVNDIENLEGVQKYYLDTFIEKPKYWVLFKSHPTIFRDCLLSYYEKSYSGFNPSDHFFSQLVELQDTALDIAITVFLKYKNSSGIQNRILDIRGRASEHISKMGSKGIDFLLDNLNNGNENDQYCALLGLGIPLCFNDSSEHKTIQEAIKKNLKNKSLLVRLHCFSILSDYKLITLEDINYALADVSIDLRRRAINELFKIGIKQETSKTLCTALEDSRREITNLVLEKLDFKEADAFEPTNEDIISLDELDQITSIIVDELILRSSERPKEIFNSKVVATALGKLFIFNPQLQSKTLYKLCDIAFQHKGSIRNRAIFVGSLLDKGEFAALVKEKVDDYPEDAKSILEIAGASLDTSSISIANRISETDPKDIQQNAANQIKLLEKYHEDGLQQAKTSFMWALILSIFSLVCLVATLYLLMSTDVSSIANVLTAVGTIFSQFLAGTQFYLYNQTRKQLTYYHQQMNQIQKFLLANSVAESLEGEAKEKSRIELVRLIATMDQVRDTPTK